MHMIDAHCHLELMKNADEVIARCNAAGMKAVVCPATHPKNFQNGLELSKTHKGFLFVGGGVHPEYVKELPQAEIGKAFAWIREHEKDIVGVGEQGLDYFWIKDPYWQEKQKELFVKSIALAKELDKVLIVHTRDAHADAIAMLEKHNAERVQLHMWGESKFASVIKDRGWMVSVGPVAARSKSHKKVIRDLPMENLMLETDSPWFGGKDAEGMLLGEPTNIKIPAAEIAEIKDVDIAQVNNVCAKNAAKLFRLPIII